MKKFPYLAAVVLAAATFGVVFGTSWRVHDLEMKNGILESQLHEALLRPEGMCPAVYVACECPEYDEGWDDAQFAEGCDPDLNELPIEDLRTICFELEARVL